MVFQKDQVRGKLIAVEGLDGSGKSTQIALLKRWLELESCKVVFTEWNSSDLVKSATRRGKKQRLLTPTTFSLIHATDFADRYERQIMPLLRAGYLVLADRYVYTAYARDAVRGCDREWVQSLYSFARQPDITYYFEVPLQVALDRILSGRPQLKFHEAGMDLDLSEDPTESFRIFQGMILEEYERQKKQFGFCVIDGSDLPENQQARMRAALTDRIDLSHYRRKTKVIREGYGKEVLR